MVDAPIVADDARQQSMKMRVFQQSAACSFDSGRLEQTRYVRVLAWREYDTCNKNLCDGWRKAELEFNTLESAADIALGFETMLRVLLHRNRRRPTRPLP